MKLNRKDWAVLDELLSKMGFGGYFDLVESLKIILKKLPYRNRKEIERLVEKQTDIYTLVTLILEIQKVVL